MVSIAGGEPLMHPQIDEIVAELIKRKKFVFLCTNALLLPKQLRQVQAVAATSPGWCTSTGCASGTTSRSARTACSTRRSPRSRLAKRRGFRVTTNTTFFNTDTPQDVIDVLDYLNDDLGVDDMLISPGLRLREGARPGALPRRRARPGSCSARRSPTGGGRSGGSTTRRCSSTSSRARRDFDCTAVGHPVVLAARLAAALLPDGRRLRRRPTRSCIETTDWDAYGRGKDPRCANCMAHCGYEPTAVLATMGSLRETIRAARGNSIPAPRFPLAGLAAAKAANRGSLASTPARDPRSLSAAYRISPAPH